TRISAMYATSGLNIREIFHSRYGICQLIHYSPGRCWIGLNEKKQSLWAPDRAGNPDLDRLRRPNFLYREHLAYLEILNPHFQADVMVISQRAEEGNSA